MNAEFQKAILMQSAFRKEVAPSERPYILSLQALGALRNVELHGLPFLKTFEPAGLDCREVHKNILAALTADEAVAFGVVEPLYCSLFCHVDTGVPFNRFTLERFGSTEGRLLAFEARAAHDRFGLTHGEIVQAERTISKAIHRAVHTAGAARVCTGTDRHRLEVGFRSSQAPQCFRGRPTNSVY